MCGAEGYFTGQIPFLTPSYCQSTEVIQITD